MKHFIIIALLALTACNSQATFDKAEIAECTKLGVAQKDMAQCRLQLRAIAAQQRAAAAAWSRPYKTY
jgi:uncharacterized lipoprotein NlpE involved in copper resistance